MDNSVKKKEIVKQLLADKKKLSMLVLAVLGILIILFSLPGEKRDGGSGESTLADYKQELEKELSELCSSVSGAGKCRVKVSFSEGEHVEYRGANRISQTPPRVLGITIVCEGGDKAEVKAALIECMSAMFDIGANRVAVLKMR